MHWEADTSLIDAAREIAPIIQKHSEEAERERRLSRPVLNCIARDGSLADVHSPVTRGIGDRPHHSRPRHRRNWSSRLCGRLDLGEPFGLGFLLRPSPRRGSRGDLQPRRGHLDRRPIWPPTKATSTEGGYRISGRAPFVSNCYDADWISSTALVDGDQHSAGEPEMVMVYFPREKCEIIDTWDVMGMRGTGSHDISVTDVYVPKV